MKNKKTWTPFSSQTSLPNSRLDPPFWNLDKIFKLGFILKHTLNILSYLMKSNPKHQKWSYSVKNYSWHKITKVLQNGENKCGCELSNLIWNFVPDKIFIFQ